ncbi:MAG: OmpA family protein [Chitinophagaceae bacterium]|nr:OmpA family protein [Chitinophagaceae bacterium]
MKKQWNRVMLLAATAAVLTGCVSRKKMDALNSDYVALNNKYNQALEDMKRCEDDLMKSRNNVSSLNQQVDGMKQRLEERQKEVEFLQGNTQQVLGRLQDLSVLSDKQAESVKKSLEKLAERDIYIKDLQSAMARKDSLNLALVMNLKGSLGAVADDDIDVVVEKGVVYISISDKLLFQSGSYNLTTRAMDVLGKVATVLNNQPNIEFLVEGHTDNVPIKGGPIKDNWDLSVLRATSVVRALQNQFNIDPKRMTAGGRSEYVPVSTNNTAAGKAANRRTRIVVLPQLDQFFQLLEPNTKAAAPGEGQ